jgi:nucleotide-binding universal stress UspA family protein
MSDTSQGGHVKREEYENRRASNEANAFVVLVAVELDATGIAAWQEGIWYANLRPDIQLHVCHVCPRVDGAEAQSALLDQQERRLREFLQPGLDANPQISERVHRHLGLADPAAEVLQLATDLEADLVIVGSHGRRGLGKVLEPSVAERIVREAHCTVFVVKPKDYEGLEKSAAVEPEGEGDVRRTASTHYAIRRSGTAAPQWGGIE